jgi:DNA polymerase III subunit epsilon
VVKLAVLDLETTGVDPLTARIVEVAIVSERSETLFHSYVNPGIPIPAEATAVHGIDYARVATRPRFGDVAGFVLEALHGRVVAGYNALAYDVPLLNAELLRVQRPPVAGPVLDGLLMWRALEPHTLAGATQRFLGRDLPGAHTALADACATAEVIGAISRLYSLPDDARALAQRFVPPSKVTPDGRLTVGKHKGRLLREVPRDYLQWMLGQDFDASTKDAVRAALAP